MERRHLPSLRKRRSSLAVDEIQPGDRRWKLFITNGGIGVDLVAAMDVSVPGRESGTAGTIIATSH
jgi:hypothetical protein